MAKRYGFENLRVYHSAEAIADFVWDMVRAWPSIAVDTLGKQLIRSADSIGANIAEGSGRSTPKDNRRFVDDARGSLYETRHWLRRAFRRKLMTTKQIDQLHELTELLGPSLNAYRNTLKRRSQPTNVKPPTSNL